MTSSAKPRRRREVPYCTVGRGNSDGEAEHAGEQSAEMVFTVALRSLKFSFDGDVDSGQRSAATDLRTPWVSDYPGNRVVDSPNLIFFLNLLNTG